MFRSSYWWLSGVTLVLVVATVVAQVPAPEVKPNNVRDFMRAKLKHSQDIVEGLAIEDFDMIAKAAQDMALLSQAANWQVLQTEEYLQHSREFRRAADALRDAAKKKNLDGSALAFMDATMKCVSCHKYVRGVRMAGLPRDTLNAHGE
jgi:hypothetical protein